MTLLARELLLGLTSPSSSTIPDSLGASHAAASAAMVLATVRRACELQGVSFRSQRFVVDGAGTRGQAIARVLTFALEESGMSWREASRQVYVLDGAGLLVEGMGVSSELRRYACGADQLAGWSIAGRRPSLRETVAAVRPTVLIGVTAHPGSFEARLLDGNSQEAGWPLVMPLSWPETYAEISPETQAGWTSAGIRIVGPGEGPDEIGGLESWVLPGVAIGAAIAQAELVDEDMVIAAARALHAEIAREPERLLPSVEELDEITRKVAVAVVRAALRNGAATNPNLSFGGLEEAVDYAIGHSSFEIPWRRLTGRE